MSTFLAVSFRPSAPAEGAFEHALSVLHRLKEQPLALRLGSGVTRAATFARLSGEEPAVARDPASGCWLAISGTWLADGDLDAAALLQVYVARGPEGLANRLEGAFTAIAANPHARTLHVITDPVGTNQTFVLEHAHGTFVSSSSLALAALDPHGRLDPLACQEFLRTGVIYERRTLHASVRRLAHGSIHTYVNGEVNGVRRWWDPRDFCTESLTGSEAADAFGASLESAVRRAARGRGRVACDLTGGYDSRVVFAACIATGVDVVPTVTGAPHTPDVVVAKQVARAAGVEVLHLPPATPATLQTVHESLRVADGEYDLVEYGQILAVHKRLAATHGLSLNGSAGEIARGKQFSFALPFLGARSSDFVKKMVATRLGDDEATPTLFAPNDRVVLQPHFEGVLHRTLSGWDEMPAYMRVDELYLMRMRVWQSRIASSTNQVWRCLSPFLVKSVLETTLSMTAGSRLASRAARRYLWRRARPLAKVPLSRGYAPVPFRPDTAAHFAGLPMHFLGRAKAKLTRGRAWAPELPQHAARTLLLDEAAVRHVLDPASMRSTSLFEPAALERFLRDATSPEFAYDGQWRRLLSLEYALRNLASLRSRASRSDEATAPF